MPLPALPLDALLTGRARPFTRPGSRSGIAKSPRDGALRVTPVGLEGDEQGDLRVHGGIEKAIHHYPREHYAAWIAELGEHPLLMQAGAFGENFSTSGWSEADVCLGDRVRAGTALLEVSQGRMPCWKLNDRFEVAGMSLRVQESGRTGWYYRVLEEGVVAAGDILQLVERRHPDWSLLRLSEVLFDRRADRRAAAPVPGAAADAILAAHPGAAPGKRPGRGLGAAPGGSPRPGRDAQADLRKRRRPPAGRESAWGCMECRKAGIKRQR